MPDESKLEQIPIWCTGFVFIDDMNKPYLVTEWNDGNTWLFFWHVEGHWTSLRKVKDVEINGFRSRKLPQDQQDTYSQAHEAWQAPTKRTDSPKREGEATECSVCGSPQVGWFVRGKALCETCADDKYEISEEPFDA